jgi:SAM-dependent methyltransferase
MPSDAVALWNAEAPSFDDAPDHGLRDADVRAKVDAVPAPVRGRVSVREGDAAAPGLAPASVDVVLCRHVLWALPDPVAAVGRWVSALRPGGRLVLVEGDWSTGAGLSAQRCAEIVGEWCSSVVVRHLPDPALWGRAITDERYLVVARP